MGKKKSELNWIHSTVEDVMVMILVNTFWGISIPISKSSALSLL